MLMYLYIFLGTDQAQRCLLPDVAHLILSIQNYTGSHECGIKKETNFQ